MPNRGYCLFPGPALGSHSGAAKRRRIDCPFVFHQGKKIGDIRKAWHTACQKAGLEGLLRITRHKTPSMYRRYRIIDENELREAQEKMQRHLNATQETRVAVIGRT